jgi:acetolactate synthase-1/2/3 large subunit
VNGAELTVEVLRREGVECVFGLPGTTVMHLLDALGRQEQIRYLSVRHEQVAAFMADGWARATGRPGVCLASRGPGAANLAIGVHNARAESVPLLVLLGQVADEVYHRDAFEEMDLVRFFEPITKWAVEIHQADRIPELLQRAFRAATSGRPGPVMVSLPLDVQLAATTAVPQPRFRPAPPAPAVAAVDAAVGLLGAAERPVVVAGGGALHPSRGYDGSLLALAERLQLPVVSTWLRKSAFPNDSPLFFGSLGYGAPALTDSLVRSADVLLALGCKFSEFASKRWTLLSPRTKLIQVDVDPAMLGRYYVPEVGICADVTATTAALLAATATLPSRATTLAARRRERLAALRATYRSQTELPAVPPRDGTVSSGALIEALRVLMARPGIVLVQDAPSFGTWIHRYLDVTRPNSFYAAAGGAMGWGFPAAMGMRLARPGDRFVALSGDGSFWMVAQDLETAVREHLPVVNVIANNFAYGNTRDRQRTAHGGRYLGVFYGNPDFAAFARLLGAHGERVEKDVELLPALERALDSGQPAVVDVIQDQHEGLPPDLAPPTAR